MPRRWPPLLLLAALSGAAQAWVWEDGNPNGVRGQIPARLSVQGRFTSYWLSGRHGRHVEVRLPRPARLDEPLALPAGDWADLTLVLDGPVTVATPGGPAVRLEVPALTVAIDDPEARNIHLEWTLPEGALSALGAGLTPVGLAEALQDGGLAVNLGTDGALAP